ncbi:MAG: ribonuclease HII, partial [Erysipelotrichaceae bacterium]
KKRNQLFEEIKQQALYYEILVISEAHIDAVNIYRATQQAMESIVQNATLASFALSDAMPLPHVDLAYEAVVKGDQKSFSIAAASILAKVTRDRLMLALHKAHPQYGFDKHKGYPTKAHLEALQTHGVLACHRKSYGPVAKQLLAQLQFTL